MLSQEIINVDDGKAAQEYELALPKKDNIKALQRNGEQTERTSCISTFLILQFMYSSHMIYFQKIYILFLFYNVVIPYFTNII